MTRASTIRNTTVLALSVFVLASASVALTRFDGGAAFLWPATALPLAYLVSRPPRDWFWPIMATFAAEWAATAIFGVGPVAGIAMAVAIAGEAAIGAIILRTAGNDLSSFESLPALAIFIVAGGIVAPGISGLIGAEVIAHHMGQAFWPNWRAWFAAHSLGTVSLAPLLLLVMQADGFRRMRSAGLWYKLEACGLLLMVAATSLVVFEQQRYPLLFLPMLPLILATFRLGRLGAAASILILAAIGGACTLLGHGPINLIIVSPGERAQFFQFYLTIAVLTVLPVAAELRRREALALRTSESEATYRLLAEKLADTLIHTSLTGKVRYASPAVADLTGFGPDEVQGRRSREFVLSEDFGSFAHARDAAVANPGQTVTAEYRIRRKDEVVITCETRMRSYADARGAPAGLILVIRDVTERRAAEARLALTATTDELTGLPNRRAFFDRLSYLEREVASGQCVGCIAIFDIDFFKAVNDTHGHATGDLVLALIAQAAKSAVRTGDMIARVGGEEFAILLWGASVHVATQTCERIRSAIETYRIPLAAGRTIGVTASFGAAEIRAGTPVETTYEAADHALYAAKAAGRNRLRIAA